MPWTNPGKLVRFATIIVIAAVIFAVVCNQAVVLIMDAHEFGVVFTKPLVYSLVSGLVLASIAFARVDIARRRSITWYSVSTVMRFIKRTGLEDAKESRFSDHRMLPTHFALWQLTKVVVLAPFLANLSFGMAVVQSVSGSDLGLSALLNIPYLSFSDISPDPNTSTSNVLPAVLPLTLIIPPLLFAIGVRVLVFVGLSGAIDILSRYARDVSQARPRFLSYISSVEMIVGIVLLWVFASLLFNSNIDYNSRYTLTVILVLAISFIVFALLDKKRARVIIYPNRRHLYSRLVTVVALAGVLGAIIVVNDSVADAKNVDLRGPYVVQQINVNQHLAKIDQVKTVEFNPSPSISIQNSNLISTLQNNSLSNILLWDQDAAQSKLKPSLGQRNDLTLSDTNLIRIGDSLYWAGSTAPTLPTDVSASAKWFDEHFVYTGSDAGLKMLQATTGAVSDDSTSFSQNRIFYGVSGDGGLFNKVWSAYPVGRSNGVPSSEQEYNGSGGIDLDPPVSWIFEPNFIFSYPDKTIHVMRYKDVYDRMNLLYPYFAYDFQFGDTLTTQFKKIHITPVSDGSRALWLVPLIVPLDTSHVPWASSFSLDFIGYALVDSNDGSVKLYITGDDAYSNLFYDSYIDSGLVSKGIPDWLGNQLKYPEEMYIWRVAKFNIYHVSSPQEFIQAQQFYEFSRENNADFAPSYYFVTPPGANDSKFAGVQLLQLHDSSSKNLVGFTTVQNDPLGLGDLTFYKSSSGSNSSLAGPSLAREALSKDKDFQSVKSVMQGNVRIGQENLYRVQGADVYFIPVYSSASSTSAAQLSSVAAVGAVPVQGSYYVGLGDTAANAFSNYVQKVVQKNPELAINATRETRILTIERLLSNSNFTLVKPTSIAAPAEFQEGSARYNSDSDLPSLKSLILNFVQNSGKGGRIYEWQVGSNLNFGTIKEVQGVPEIHYITIEIK